MQEQTNPNRFAGVPMPKEFAHTYVAQLIDHYFSTYFQGKDFNTRIYNQIQHT